MCIVEQAGAGAKKGAGAIARSARIVHDNETFRKNENRLRRKGLLLDLSRKYKQTKQF